jgi:hypothetical protein
MDGESCPGIESQNLSYNKRGRKCVVMFDVSVMKYRKELLVAAGCIMSEAEEEWWVPTNLPYELIAGEQAIML